jgi:hypothetical protein
MTTIFLTNGEFEIEIQVTNTDELIEMAKAYFEYQYPSLSLSVNNITLNKSKSLSFYNITDNDVILISNAQENYEIEEMDMLHYTSPHILASNGTHFFKVLIDTGAQKSIIGKNIAQKLNLLNDVNTKLQQKLIGVGGTVQSDGVIHNTAFNLGNGLMVQVSLTVVEHDDFIFGMDFLTKNHCKIDIIGRTLEFNGHIIPFMNELDMQKYKDVIQIDSTENKDPTPIQDMKVEYKETSPDMQVEDEYYNIPYYDMPNEYTHMDKSVYDLLLKEIYNGTFPENNEIYNT